MQRLANQIPVAISIKCQPMGEAVLLAHLKLSNLPPKITYGEEKRLEAVMGVPKLVLNQG